MLLTKVILIADAIGAVVAVLLAWGCVRGKREEMRNKRQLS